MKHPSSLAFLVSFILIISFIGSEGRNITPLDYNEGKNQTGWIYTIPNSTSTGRATNCSEKECFESYGLMRDYKVKTEVAGAVYQVKRATLTGASGLFNVWNVYVARSACSGARLHMNLTGKIIEFGWRVLPRVYPDGLARLFISMEDGRGNQCSNEECRSFHFASNRYSFSEPFPHISTFNGEDVPVKLSIYKDPRTGDKWWTSVNDERFGYLPTNAFDHFFVATTVRWEGFVSDERRHGEPHTDTGMGTGGYPDSGYGRTAFIVDMLVKSSQGEFQPPVSLLTHATTPGCYGVMSMPTLANEGPGILYGGPGGPSCDTYNRISD